MELSGRVAVVTGSAKRIGRAIAENLAQAGAAVIINGRSSLAEAEAVAAGIQEAGGRAVACVADVSQPEGAELLMACAVEAFGGIDILVNNAGIRPHDAFADMNYEKWRKVTATIMDGSFLCALAASPYLTKSKYGRIINIGGTSAHRGARGRIHVVTAKSALVGLTKGLALELAPHVTVNCVVPALIEDNKDSAEEAAARRARLPLELVPLGRTGSPDDVAGVIRFLCSDAASYMTGQVLHLNGGVYLC